MARMRSYAAHGGTGGVDWLKPVAGRDLIMAALALGILGASAGTAPAQILLSDNFNNLKPAGALTGNLQGTGFTVTAGNVDIIGDTAGR